MTELSKSANAGPPGDALRRGPDPGVTAAPDETELVGRLRAGDPDAFELVVRANAGRMLAVARRLLRSEDDAADAVQDAFLSAMRAIDRFEGTSRIGTWLHRITVNAALMKLRSATRRNEVSIESLLPTFAPDGHRDNPRRAFTPPSDDELERREMRQRIRARIDELPDDHRTVLVLRDVEELDTEETATVLGITAGAVKTRLHRARMALRELLERDFAAARAAPPPTS
ncbi:MAG: sigma-70 family RNA polymerase sigma factor [Phycisphaerales bacterium]